MPLPDLILVEIFRRLPVKDRVKLLTVSSHWRQLMPFADRHGCLNVTELPFNEEFLRGSNPRRKVLRMGITSALKAILPQVGSELKSIKFGSGKRGWEPADEHFDLVAEFCHENLMDFKAEKMCLPAWNDVSFASLRHLSHLRSVKFVGYYRVDDNWSEADSAAFLPTDLSNLIPLWDVRCLEVGEFCWARNTVAPPLGLTDVQLALVCQMATNLTVLTLWNCQRLTDWTPIAQLTQLNELCLTDCSIDESAMELIARKCLQLSSIEFFKVEIPRLKWLRHIRGLKSFSFFPGFKHLHIVDMPKNWSVEELEIGNPNSAVLTYADLLFLRSKTPLLRRLTLNDVNITAGGNVSLPDRWDQLETLALTGDQITDKSVTQAGISRNLRLLILDKCYQISTEGLLLLAIKRRDLAISTPLVIRFDCEYLRERICGSPLIDDIKEELEKVNVRLLA